MREPNQQDAGRHLGSVERLKRRADFLRAGKGKRWHGKTLSLQANAAGSHKVRVGFTLTRKVGNAVIRNRARRRLKEAVRMAPALPFRTGHDYVIIGRLDAIHSTFDDLLTEVSRAVAAVHGATRGGDRPQRTRPKP